MVRETEPEGEHARLEAAKLIGEPDCFGPLLSTLVRDSAHSVIVEAIRSVGKLHKRRMVQDLLDYLDNPKLAPEASHAPGEFGDAIVGSLQDYLVDPSVTILRREKYLPYSSG
jgi:hypothetical protein